MSPLQVEHVELDINRTAREGARIVVVAPIAGTAIELAGIAEPQADSRRKFVFFGELTQRIIHHVRAEEVKLHIHKEAGW